ncbi:13237_t:CDS:1, partial [Dentiscutata heterogama]
INYDNDKSAFNNNDQIDDESNILYNYMNIEKSVKMALYNTINYYWQVLSEEEILAALLDS